MDIYDFPDPRRPIERIRRVHLREICLKKGIQLPSPMPPATVMRQLIDSEGGIETVLQRPDQPVYKIETGEIDARSDELIRASLKTKKMHEVRKICKSNGVLQTPKDTKAILIDRLMKHAS